MSSSGRISGAGVGPTSDLVVNSLAAAAGVTGATVTGTVGVTGDPIRSATGVVVAQGSPNQVRIEPGQIRFGQTLDTNLFRDSLNVLRTSDALRVDLSFGCNGATPQSAAVVGAALGAAGIAYSQSADQATRDLVNQIRAALIADGILQ